jgi:Uma2 family endonuclease
MNTKLKILTIADWDAMSHGDGNRYEIIEGELFVSRSPGLTHQIVWSNLTALIWSYLKTNPIGTVVGNPGLVLSNITGVIPDLVFFRKDQRETIVKDDRLNGAPALVIEIVSPGPANIRRDRITKLQLYAAYGIPEYWIVDPKSKTLEKYVNSDSTLILQETLGEDESLTTMAIPGFLCRIREIFSEF